MIYRFMVQWRNIGTIVEKLSRSNIKEITDVVQLFERGSDLPDVMPWI